LFNLESDLSETTDVLDAQPEVVRRLEALAEQARSDLGDGTRIGANVRPPGSVERPKP
jgi:arylsulfatase A